MKRFKNILLVAGGKGWEETALKRAVALAKKNQAQLTVVDVIEELPREMGILITLMTPQELQEHMLNDRQNQLEQFIEPVRKEGIKVSANVLIGTPFLEIIREVLRSKHDLVIKTAIGENKLKEGLFGSMAMHLMRKCPCPVWVIKQSHRKQYRKILAAVDPDPSDKMKTALNKKIIELASSLSRLEGSELHVIHVWHPYYTYIINRPLGLSKSEVSNLNNEILAMHKDRLDELIEKYAPETANDRVHLYEGAAEIMIPDFAKKKRIELIVMGTVCRTGIEGFFIGNTAEKVLQQIDCSVLTVKPDGFVTPVKLR